VLTSEERDQLKQMVGDSMAQVEENAREQYRIDLKTAREVASRCRLLLEHYEEFSDHEKSLVAGAVRYFVIDDDPLSDEIFATGFDDDAMVVNHVLEQLGIDGMFIELD
jgi:uncharacterized membrane protein YkvA (DUF1232 family)